MISVVSGSVKMRKIRPHMDQMTFMVLGTARAPIEASGHSGVIKCRLYMTSVRLTSTEAEALC